MTIFFKGILGFYLSLNYFSLTNSDHWDKIISHNFVPKIKNNFLIERALRIKPLLFMLIPMH